MDIVFDSVNCQIKKKLQNFIEFESSKNKNVPDPIACVTSGGTTVPLELNTVRFIDNFSSGNRGANSVECFLNKGYRVIFLYRQSSVFPFTKGYRSLCGGNTMNEQFLQYVSKNISDSHNKASNSSNSHASFHTNKDDVIQLIESEQKSYILAQEQNRLICVPFENVIEYLNLLQYIAYLLNSDSQLWNSKLKGGKDTNYGSGDSCNRYHMIYCAAAVSDYYIPSHEMNTHKIQSTESTVIQQKPYSSSNEISTTSIPIGINTNTVAQDLVLTLSPVPKLLGQLTSSYPFNYYVSFKLETDSSMLHQKASGALFKYNVDIVVANLLQTRYQEVTMFEKNFVTELDISNISNTVTINNTTKTSSSVCNNNNSINIFDKSCISVHKILKSESNQMLEADLIDYITMKHKKCYSCDSYE